MLRFILILFAIIAIPSCDCEPGPTGPAALFKDLIKHPNATPPNSIQLKQFRSALQHSSSEELHEMMALLNSFQGLQDPPHQAWRINAEAVIDELWERNPNPNPHALYKMLGGDNIYRFRNRIILKRLAKVKPTESWLAVDRFYQRAYQTGASADCAITLFAGLQEQHPEFALQFLAEIIVRPTLESYQLRAHAIAGILAGISSKDEALAFIDWIYRHDMEAQSMGFIERVYPKITPREFSLNSVITNCLSKLAKTSRTAAENWINLNKERLPKSWAIAYLHGAAQNGPSQYHAAYEFIARSTSRGDGILEDLFDFHGFGGDEALVKKLLKIREPNAR